MTIVWNKVTWYSKLLAAIFFIFVVPALAFCIGRTYGNTELAVRQYKTSVVTPSGSMITPIPKNLGTQTAATITSSLSGVSGIATLGPKCPVQVSGNPCPDNPYFGDLVVTTENGRIVTMTKTRPDGKFVIFLSPGTYTISLPSLNKSLPRLAPTAITITKGAIIHTTLHLDNGIR